MQRNRVYFFISFALILGLLLFLTPSWAFAICTDNDGDGYAIEGGVCGEIDCDDSDPNVYPGAKKLCDGKDTNCDGRRDFKTDVDADGDGVVWCAGDCDDNDPNRFPGNPEVCDGIDNDCNGILLSTEHDSDKDGYRLCDPIPDCNDFDASVYPGADEICGDNKDNNCDGTIDEAGCICPDSDADGQTADFCGGTDCDDSDPNVYLGAVENCTDGIDNDCDGLIDLADPNAVNCPTCTDNDADGYAIDGGVCGPIDCDDSDPNVYPGAPEICDGKDSNCDGRQVSTDVDNDGDGVAWCAGDCDDTNPNMFPGNQEGPYGDITCSDGIDNDCDTRIDEYDGDCAAPTCTTKTTPKDGPHMFNLLNPIDDSVIKLSCDWCHYDDSGTIDQRTECQRCHADPNDPSDPLNGVLKQLYPLSPPYGFGTAPNVKLHSSTVVGTKYGNWDMDCLNCHNPHLQEQDAKYGTTYGKYIKEYICFDNTVTGQSFEEFIEFTASSGPGSFADGPPYNENICEMCHTQTNHHRRTGDAPGDLDGIGNYIGHYDGIKCTDCHVHEEGFKPSCGSCHDAPPPTGTHLKHFGGTKDDAEYGSTAITQDYTSYDTKYLINCGNCHPIDPSNHINGVPNSGGGDAEIELYNPNAPAGSLKARNPSTATYTPGTIVYTDSKGFKYTLGTCSNVYCHSYTEFSTSGEVPEPTVPPLYPPLVYDPPWETFVVTTTRYQTPTWGVDSLGCDGCHGYPIQTEYPTVSAGVGDSHAWVDDYGYVDLHIWNMGFGPLQCNTCHYDTVREDFMWTQDDLGFVTLTDIPIYNTAKHVNGSKDVAFTPIPVLYQTSLGDVYHSLTDATFNPNTKTCYNVSCHKYQTEVKWGSPYRWWIGVECNVCHQM
jgi:predicted CxxxxCH...CXXCH cytochrome family protein